MRLQASTVQAKLEATVFAGLTGVVLVGLADSAELVQVSERIEILEREILVLKVPSASTPRG